VVGTFTKHRGKSSKPLKEPGESENGYTRKKRSLSRGIGGGFANHPKCEWRSKGIRPYGWAGSVLPRGLVKKIGVSGEGGGKKNTHTNHQKSYRWDIFIRKKSLYSKSPRRQGFLNRFSVEKENF